MSTHVPHSSSVCIHSICVSPDHRRKGVGSHLLREYVSRLENTRKDGSAPYERILLITHEDLRPFYEKCGFEWIGRSEVVHGSRTWFEMRKILDCFPRSPPSTQTSVSLPPAQDHCHDQQIPPGLWDVLQRPSRDRPQVRLLSSFSGRMADVLVSDAGSRVNKFDVLCPRNGCASVILKHGVAKLVERSAVQMEPPEDRPHPLLPTLPAAPATTQWWLVTPSPMAFENIGFSRPVPSQNQATDKKLKLLACAECDLGPLGWSEEGGTEFWLACARVGYRERA